MSKGNIFIDNKGIDVSNIDVKQRNQVLKDFYEMICSAEKNDDLFFCVFSDEWEEFYSKLFTEPYWEGVDFNIVYGLQNDFHNPKLLHNIRDFQQEPEPKTHGGFEYDQHPSANYIFNINTWKKWHYEFFYNNPQFIEWKENELWPCFDNVINLVKEEIKRYNINLNNESELFNVFHSQIMGKLNERDRISYANDIGCKICEENYYHREKDLEKLEKAQGNDKARTIFSIKKNDQFQFLSIDTQHGMFELCNDRGDHLGEYRFDGRLNGENTKDSTHSLKCVAKWKKKYNK